MEIAARIAVITGAASGIGRAVAIEFAQRGADVVVADIRADRLEEVVAEVEASGRKALAVRCDVTADHALPALAEASLRHFGRVDIVMNNAGTGMAGPPDSIPLADWRALIELNLLSVVRGINAFVPLLVGQGLGWVVNTASIGGMYAYDHSDAQLPYVTTKFAVRGLTEALYLYLRPRGVGVSCLCPGRVETNIAETSRLVGTDDDSWIRVPRLNGVRGAAEVARQVADAIATEQFLILTDPEDGPMLAERYRDLDAALARQAANPSPPRGPAYGWD